MTEIEQVIEQLQSSGRWGLATIFKEHYASLITTIESQATEIEELEEQRDSIQRDYDSACEMSTDNHKEALRLFDIVESQKEEIERLTLQIKRAHLSLTCSNTENQIPHAIHYLEQAAPITPESPEYVAAVKIFLQEGEKP